MERADRNPVELVREIYRSWEQGEFGTDTEVFDQDIEFEMHLGPEAARTRGFEQMRAAWRDQLSAWEDWRTGPIDELIPRGEHLIALSRVTGRGRRSGIEVDQAAAAVFEIRGGKVVSLRLYGDREQAFAVLEARG